ncbi:hypothetical protein ACH4RC_26725, partial [Streptomyces sp. NPDC016845]
AILRRCDQEGVAAYGECTTLGSRRLFERCGFRPLPEVVLPDGTRIHPVWRDPRVAPNHASTSEVSDPS